MVDSAAEGGKQARMDGEPLFLEGSSQLAKEADGVDPEREYTTPDQLKFYHSLDLPGELRRPMIRENLIHLTGKCDLRYRATEADHRL